MILAVGVFLREFQDIDSIAPLGSYACGLVLLSALLTVFTFPGDGTSGISLSLGYSFFLTVVGAVAGIVAGQSRGGSGWGGGEYKSLSGPVTGPYANPATPLAPDSTPSTRSLPHIAGQAAHDYGQATRKATAAAPTARNAAGLRRLPGMASTPETAVDSVRGTLRFVARSVEISAAGVSVIYEDGSRRDLLWSDVDRIVVRRLPPDPPFDKTMFLDLIVGEGGVVVRLLASTRANYDALPEGLAMGSRENLRNLGCFAIAQGNGVFEPESEPFFNEAKMAPMFQAIKQFASYDAQFG